MTRSSNQVRLTSQALEEARNRYREQGDIHDKATSEVSLWLSVSGVVLGALVFLSPQTFHARPSGFLAGWRLTLVLIGYVLFGVATFYLRRFFFGRDITFLGDPEGWLKYLNSLESASSASVRVEQELAIAYARVAAKRFEENKSYLREQRAAKTWVAFSALATGFAGLCHLLHEDP